MSKNLKNTIPQSTNLFLRKSNKNDEKMRNKTNLKDLDNKNFKPKYSMEQVLKKIEDLLTLLINFKFKIQEQEKKPEKEGFLNSNSNSITTRKRVKLEIIEENEKQIKQLISAIKATKKENEEIEIEKIQIEESMQKSEEYMDSDHKKIRSSANKIDQYLKNEYSLLSQLENTYLLKKTEKEKEIIKENEEIQNLENELNLVISEKQKVINFIYKIESENNQIVKNLLEPLSKSKYQLEINKKENESQLNKFYKYKIQFQNLNDMYKEDLRSKLLSRAELISEKEELEDEIQYISKNAWKDYSFFLELRNNKSISLEKKYLKVISELFFLKLINYLLRNFSEKKNCLRINKKFKKYLEERNCSKKNLLNIIVEFFDHKESTTFLKVVEDSEEKFVKQRIQENLNMFEHLNALNELLTKISKSINVNIKFVDENLTKLNQYIKESLSEIGDKILQHSDQNISVNSAINEIDKHIQKFSADQNKMNCLSPKTVFFIRKNIQRKKFQLIMMKVYKE